MYFPRLALAALLLPSSVLAQTVLVKPYVQPGNGVGLDSSDVKVLAWLTDQRAGDFSVEYTVPGLPPRAATPERVALDFRAAKPAPVTAKVAATPLPATTTVPIPVTLEEVKAETIKQASPPIRERAQHYFKYSVTLPDLPFDSAIRYRVKLGGKIVRTGSFRTRASATKPIRFVAVGDLANGKSEQNGIAYQISRVRPDFLVALGDIVYSSGRVSQYLHHFWTTYNDVEKPGPKTGAPLMASIPFYPIIGNHDADAVKLPDTPDAFGAYYFFSGPLNGPGLGAWNTPLGKDAAVAAMFRAKVGSAYPALNIYSFDYGSAHFVALDTNGYNTKSFLELVPWIERDLQQSRQRWKFVCFHAPAFHTSTQHFTEQKMRLLMPVFQANGVDVVFAGHVHNYQRTKPLLFQPNPPVRDPKGRVNGDYTLDETFDGLNDTTPEGIIHVTTGGGGASLYHPKEFSKMIEQLKKDNGANYVPITAHYLGDKHSFSLIELTPDAFVLRQISIDGKEVDRFRITKAPGLP